MKNSKKLSAYSLLAPTIALSLLINCGVLRAQSLNQNYVIAHTIRVSGIKTDADLRAVTSDKTKVQSAIQYADGLGRPLQTVQRMASPAGNDIVQPVAYDSYGREVTSYLPYVPTVTTGIYQPSAISAQSAFYTSPPAGVGANAYPFAGKILEASPLSRPLEQGSPGAAWQLSTSTATDKGHTTKIAYLLNNNISFASDSVNSRQVALYNVTINIDKSRSVVRNGTYGANTLNVTVARDENWVIGRAGTVEEYKDDEGHVVLKRQYNYKNSALEVLSTYYVYDDMGNLCYVLPPLSGADMASSISAQVISDLCYEYWYDELGRPFRKKLPGKGWDFIVYNTFDQVVMTQDANQRNKTPQQWSFSKYDALGRVIATGIYAQAGTTADNSIYFPNNGNFVAVQNAYNTTTAPKWEARNNATSTGYDNLSDPLPFSSLTFYAINFYDDYSAPAAMSPAAYTAPAAASLATQGLPTYQYTNVLGTTGMLCSKIYYDGYGRPLKTYKQHYLGAAFNAGNYDAVNTTYSFAGAVTTNTRQHFTTASAVTPAVTIANTYIYDHAGRKLKSWMQITNGTTPLARTLLSSLAYNETGQLKTKNQHSTDSLTYLQTIGYSYNERGWLSMANSALFQVSLYYNTLTNKQYNGNIMYQYWGTSAAPNTSRFLYQYDKLNRLASGVSLDNYNEQNIAYDKQGNINALRRYLNNALVDDLTYTYNGTNQLKTITDATANDAGLKHGTWNYTYDNNGNLVVDPSKGLNTTFNVLNLPQSNTLTGASPGTVTYTYDATGNKLRKASTVGTAITTEYISGIQYSNTSGSSAIDFIQTEEGRAVRNGTGYNYEYNLPDHLGNTRVSFATVSGSAVQIQKDDYMPFGMEISRSVSGPKNEYLYNKKELQDELVQYDYGARFYDPTIGRWNAVDPLAEKFSTWTPYNYGFNNPIRFIDPDGRAGTDWVKGRDGDIKWDKDANSQETTKKGEEYLGKDLTLTFNSYIDGKLWDGPGGNIAAGDKLTSTIKITGNENEAGELTSISATKSLQLGDTPVGSPRDYYPGLGEGQNKFVFGQTKNADGTLATYGLNFEQHASVSKIEEFGLNAIGYNIVNVAQKLNVNYSGGKLSLSTYTDVFPSATLKMNGGTQLMHYAQPSFKATHSPLIDGYKPAHWYKRP